MPKDYSRTRRIGEQMQRELAQLLQREVKDPRLAVVTITAVEVTRDLSLATVYYTLPADTPEPERYQQALEKAAGFLRHALGERMLLRSLPQLKFRFDQSLQRGTELSELIDSVIAADRKKKQDTE